MKPAVSAVMIGLWAVASGLRASLSGAIAGVTSDWALVLLGSGMALAGVHQLRSKDPARRGVLGWAVIALFAASGAVGVAELLAL